MNNAEQSRLIMIQYALRLYELACKENYVLITSHQECFDILWDCQCALMEFNEYISNGYKEKKLLEGDQSLRRAYAHQLLNVARSGVYLKSPDFSHITEADLNKIVLI